MRTSVFRRVRLTLCALFVALTAICAQLQIPTPTAPVNLALLPVLLCGALLGARSGALAMAAYALLAAAGVPVLSGFAGGLGVVLGPTGGYVLGYMLCAAVTGAWAKRAGLGARRLAIGMALGVIACYVPGTLWFARVTGTGFAASAAGCVLPFLPGDAVKIAVAAALAGRLDRAMQRLAAG